MGLQQLLVVRPGAVELRLNRLELAGGAREQLFPLFVIALESVVYEELPSTVPFGGIERKDFSRKTNKTSRISIVTYAKPACLMFPQLPRLAMT